MSYDGSAHRRQRGTGKCLLSRMVNTMEALLKASPSAIKPATLENCQDNVAKAHRVFQEYHDLIVAQDTTLTDEQNENELRIHDDGLLRYQEAYYDVKHRAEAWLKAKKLKASLEALEAQLAGRYLPDKAEVYAAIEADLDELRVLYAPDDISEHNELRRIGEEIEEVWLRVVQVRADAGFSSERLLPGVEGVSGRRPGGDDRRHRSHLKVPPPTFAGQLSEYNDFKKLFMSVVDVEDVSEPAKKALLINAMSTPETKANAVSACKEVETLVEAMKTFGMRYDDKKEVVAYHLGMILNVPLTGQNKVEIENMERVARNSISGLKLVDSFTGAQITIACMINRMKPELKKEWLQRMAERKDPPDLDTFFAFLRAQSQVVTGLKTMESVVEQDQAGLSQRAGSSPKERYQGRSHFQKYQKKEAKSTSSKTVFHTSKERSCNFCDGNHVIHSCREFKSKSLEDKQAAVKSKRLCHNCLSIGHKVAECPSERNCPTCGGRHHSFLHEDREPRNQSNVNRILTASDKSLATTASVIVDSGGVEKAARLLIDTGAEVSVVTESLAKSLKAERLPHSAVRLIGMGQTDSSYAVKISLHGDERVGRGGDVLEITAQVVKEIAQPTGTRAVSEFMKLPCVKQVPLADPTYKAGARIDILLSNSGWCTSRMEGSRRDEDTGVFLDKSMFGWVMAGPLKEGPVQPRPKRLRVFAVTGPDKQLSEQIERQWKLEELPGEESPLSRDEISANEHFYANHTREDGRHLVGIPPADNSKVLGESYSQAARRYRSVQKTLVKRGQWEEYQKAILGFIEDGHAELVPEEDLRKPHDKSYYMPMHAIVKPSSTSTKIRPVCDASASSSSGYSYNDVILAGPSLYQPLFSIVNKWRDSPVGMTADVSRMYRQITLHKDDRDYHRFLFSIDGGPLKVYRMTRLTFGVKSSPFLACKVIEEIGSANQETHPLAAKVLKEQVYMDDVLTGAETVQEATAIRKDLNEVLTENKFTLCKWRTSSKELMESIPEVLRETIDLTIGSSPRECQKALGIHWSTEADELFVATPKFKIDQSVTKRVLTSCTARIFDPMGWHAPAVMSPRMMTQEAWKIPSGWDEPLPDRIFKPFKQWAEQMPDITNKAIPRAFGNGEQGSRQRELHGFADASEGGYGGVVYLRTEYSSGKVTVDQVIAKGRVAPLKKLTIPRLELKGALVAAQLLQAAAKDLKIPPASQYLWSDSMVVLGWLEHSPSRLETFVANRVAKIQSLLESGQWAHVPGVENPADCLSRGVTPRHLTGLKLWWEGPGWLKLPRSSWPRSPGGRETPLPEMKTMAAQVVNPPEELGHGQKKLLRWNRVLAWCLRFADHCRKKSSERRTGKILTATELMEAKTKMMVASQRFHYQSEYECLVGGKLLPKNNPLARYAPFVDEVGVIRIGGRLEKADLPKSAIHPILLSPNSEVTRMVVEQAHQKMRHCSTSAMLATVAYGYHVPRLARMLRSIRNKCMACQKAFAKPAGQMMGDLPAVRTNPAEVFSVVGVDYAGPVYIKTGRGKNFKRVPTYLALLVCMATRAIHIEVAADASTAVFLAVLDRFCSRRGVPSKIFSDNGGNFVGANSELRQITADLRTDESEGKLANWAVINDIEWQFSPARSPNFGGLWEAGVKGMKRLMGKVLKSPNLSLDELTTIAVSSEAILNSRPYLPLYSTVEDEILPLTPGHFLVGRPLSALPQRVQSLSRLSKARRWQLVKELEFQIWSRWRKGYLHSLNARAKQREPQRNLEVGDVVMVMTDGVRRCQWPIARVSKVFPGEDDLVRVAEVTMARTATDPKRGPMTTLRRSIRKLIPLPLKVNGKKGVPVQEEDTGP